MRTISSWWLRAMAESFKWQGLPINALFSSANIPLDELSNNALRFPQANVSALWKQAQAMIPDCHLGVYVGSHMNVRAIPVVGMAIIQTSNLLNAFHLILRYQKLMGDTTNVTLLQHGNEYELRFQYDDGERDMSLLSYEAPMAFCVKIARTVKGKHWVPTRIDLKRTTANQEVADYFNCPITYGSQTHSLYFQEQALTCQPLTTNCSYGAETNIRQVVTILLEERLALADISCAALASAMNMSEKTLRRRLAKEGTNYTQILTQLRKRKSTALLTETTIANTEVAFLLGYSELSSFNHAFYRWFGISPSQFRLQHSQ